jgi:DNA end-binding protein Ku
MAAPRANWKGTLKIGEIACPVALFTAASTSERVAFHILNRKTGDRVHREYIDAETGKPVDAKDQVKGYERERGDYVVLEPEEIAEAIPESDKTLSIQAFIPCAEVDDVFFDRPYFLAPSDPAGMEAYELIRDGMRSNKVVAIARTLLFRRMRSLLIRPDGDGLIATTLNFDYEIRPAKEAFAGIPASRIEGEMLDLALHIIKTKAGKFDPRKFDDRYDAALLELVKAKSEGRTIEAPKPPEPTKVVDLMDALRQSARQKKHAGRSRAAAPRKTARRMAR